MGASYQARSRVNLILGIPRSQQHTLRKRGSRICMHRGHARFVPKFWRDRSCFASDVAVDVEDSCLLDSTSETNSERAATEARLLQLPTSIILNFHDSKVNETAWR